MGFLENVKNEVQQRQEARIALSEPITIEELHALMTERWNKKKYGNFKMVKVLAVKYISFDDYMMMRYSAQISSPVGHERKDSHTKNSIVHIATNSVKGYSSLNKEQKTQIRDVIDPDTFLDRAKLREYELEHLKVLADAMREVLKAGFTIS
ncbi:MAG: hypothetical protein FWG53_02715 [Clostridiales bacterium]|nr:hypothetical protein [Clostridiales bacterium]